jgi:predicted dehydrogenase
MKILIVGHGFYVMGDSQCRGGTVLPAVLSWANLYDTDCLVEIFSREGSTLKATSRLDFFLSENKQFKTKVRITNDLSSHYDCCIIAIPEIAHVEMFRNIGHIKQVICVKPVGIDSSSFNDITNIVKSNRQMAYVDFHKRFDPANIAIINELKNSKSSDFYFSFSYGQKREMSKIFFKKWADSSNPFQYLAPHYLDIILFGTGLVNTPIVIEGSVLKPMGGLNDFLAGQIEIKGGGKNVIVDFDCNWIEPDGMPYSSRQRIECFSNDVRFVSEQDNRGLMEWGGEVRIPNPHYRVETVTGAFGYGVDIYHAFLSSIGNPRLCATLPKIEDYSNVAKIVSWLNKKIK